jgi:hypothetical protein
MFDYSNLGADYFRDAIGEGLTLNGETLSPLNVFSDALPSRDWLGDPTLEITELETVSRHYVDGSSRDLITLAVLFRSRQRETAFEFAVEARETLLPQWLTELKTSGLIDDWVVDASPIAPDVRNLEIGETFATQISVSIIEKKAYFGL